MSVSSAFKRSAQGYTAFGCLASLPDFAGTSSEPVVTGVVQYPGPHPVVAPLSVDCRVGLVQHPSHDPFAALAEDMGSMRFYFLFNLLDPETRSMLERSAAHGKFQMLLTGEERGDKVSFGFREPFQEPLARTAWTVPRPFEHWVKTAIEMAPALPKLFAEQFPGSKLASISHCAVVMLPPSWWGDVHTFLGTNDSRPPPSRRTTH